MDKSVGSGTDILDSTSASSVLSYTGLGRKSIYEQKKLSKLADAQLFYQKNLGGGSAIDVLVGHGYQDFFTDDFINAQRYLNDKTIPGTEPVDSFLHNGFAIESYLGRVNLTLVDKYLLTASIRRDASSKFSPENRVGIFPAFAFAWKLKEELFKSVDAITDLKLRLGWGSTGQQDGINYSYYLPLYYKAMPTARYQFGNTFYFPYRPSAYNKDLKWETTTTTNLGLDFGIFSNRINGSVDYYVKKTKDLLSYVDIAPGANFDITQLRNIGSLENKGVEISVNTVPIKEKEYSWDFNFNVTYNTSKITSLYGQEDNPNFKGIEVGRIQGGTGNNIGVHAVGQTPFTFLPLKQVYDQSGKPIEGLYEDINRDGVISDADRYYFNHASPSFLFGLSTGFNYKKLSFGITGHGMAGNYLYNNYNANSAVLRNIENPVLYLGNAGVNYLQTHFTNNRYQSDYYIENASFFKIDNINLGYDFGKIVNNDRVRLRLNASVQNIATFTKYSGNDPENAGSDGIENNIYPRPRIYSLGLNFDF
jgi:iron complex outermembrane receptor protein